MKSIKKLMHSGEEAAECVSSRLSNNLLGKKKMKSCKHSEKKEKTHWYGKY